MQNIVRKNQNGCHLATLKRIITKLEYLPILVLHSTRFLENHLKTFCIILFTDGRTDGQMDGRMDGGDCITSLTGNYE